MLNEQSRMKDISTIYGVAIDHSNFNNTTVRKLLGVTPQNHNTPNIFYLKLR